jgi:hypothetical protein
MVNQAVRKMREVENTIKFVRECENMRAAAPRAT